MDVLKSRRFLIGSIAGMLALPGLASTQEAPSPAAGEKVACYGVNKCKATGDCGGPGHSCAGQNTCKREGYIDMDKDTCLRIDGGRLTAAEEKSAPAAEAKKD